MVLELRARGVGSGRQARLLTVDPRVLRGPWTTTRCIIPVAHDRRTFARSLDERYLAVQVGPDIRIYSTRPEDLVQMACKRTLRALNGDEWRRFMGTVPPRPACAAGVANR